MNPPEVTVESALRARKQLARGLNALQSPGMPSELHGIAEPVARAMGLLHEIERSRGASAITHALVALAAVREALSTLQHAHQLHPAVAEASREVAEALGLVHALAHPARPARARAATEKLPRAEAALGAHSASNFYRGLRMGDLVDVGGVFVATYAQWPIGQRLQLKVSMPGGYEFDSEVEVAWVREARTLPGRLDAPAGFGARFIGISPEARALVQRYVKNREPLFHDEV